MYRLTALKHIKNKGKDQSEDMSVYVQDINGHPLMPTDRNGWVRKALKAGKAKVVTRRPFTIRLTYETKTNAVQPITLGVDAGSEHIGLSASTETKEVYASEVELRTDIVKNISTRREQRRFRRYRKTRYRKARFSNRVHSKSRGWLAPSVEAKINYHVQAVRKIMQILPIASIVVETASFDTQKIKAIMEGRPLPEGTDYQQGEMMDFWNVREYVFFRDNHTCQCCKGKSGCKELNVHHIESRKTGGNAPNNLVTLCETCHDKYHRGEIKLPKTIKRGESLRDAAFMGIMRWTLFNRLKEIYPGIVTHTYGYITKNTRITNGLEKNHATDALCIANHPKAVRVESVFIQKRVRRHNRQLHKMTILKGGIRKPSQAPREVKGFRLNDKVLYNGQECFVHGRRTSGYFDLRLIDGTLVHPCASWKNIYLLEHTNSTLTKEVRLSSHD